MLNKLMGGADKIVYVSGLMSKARVMIKYDNSKFGHSVRYTIRRQLQGRLLAKREYLRTS